MENWNTLPYAPGSFLNMYGGGEKSPSVKLNHTTIDNRPKLHHTTLSKCKSSKILEHNILIDMFLISYEICTFCVCTY